MEKPLPPNLLNEAAQRVYIEAAEGSDLACVLLITAYLDNCLLTLLNSHLRSCKTTLGLLSSGKGALGSIVIRNKMCYSMGLLNKPHFQSINSILEIRNEFAHEMYEREFSNDDIALKCQELQCHLWKWSVPHPIKNKQDNLSKRSMIPVKNST